MKNVDQKTNVAPCDFEMFEYLDDMILDCVPEEDWEEVLLKQYKG